MIPKCDEFWIFVICFNLSSYHFCNDLTNLSTLSSFINPLSVLGAVVVAALNLQEYGAITLNVVG
jgi:hypothetical protein